MPAFENPFTTAWAIMLGLADRRGERIMPTLRTRKRFAVEYGVNPSKANWRRWLNAGCVVEELERTPTTTTPGAEVQG